MNTTLVFDDHTLLALGRGHRKLSQLVVLAMRDPSLELLAPVLCVLEADRQREGLGEHVGGLETLHPVDLRFSSALAVSDLVRKGLPLGAAHAHVTAAPSPYRPDGATIATVAPENYARVEVRVLDLNT
ncbi:hypothetical protein [Streptomyces sp. NPDC054784]